MDRKVWNIEEFNKVNLPEVIGSITNRNRFSEFNRTRVLDLPIHMPGQGWKIPSEINNFLEPIKLAAKAESRFGDFLNTHYVYVTIDQKVVQAGKTGRRAGAHSDAYIEVDEEQLDLIAENADAIAKEKQEVSHTYVIADQVPTEFFNAKFPLVDSSCNGGSLKTFDEIAEKAEIITYPGYTLLRMDPYVVHRSALVTETMERTFMKISFSRKKYARKGNTVNPGFEYDWELTARSPDKRNHPWK